MSVRGFRQAARFHFRFLVSEFGFKEERLPIAPLVNSCQIRFANERIRVVIEGTSYGTRAGVSIGRFRPILDMPEPANLTLLESHEFTKRCHLRTMKYGPYYSVDDILEVCHGVQSAPKQLKGKSTWMPALTQYEQIKWYADSLRTHCREVLKGELSKVARHKKIGRQFHG